MDLDLHPQIVHFPIVLIIVSFFLHLIQVIWKKNETSFLGFSFAAAGLIFGFITAITGEKAEETAEAIGISKFHNAIENHENFANLTIWLLLPLVIGWAFFLIKKGKNRAIDLLILVLLLFLASTVIYTGHLGGKLVYELGVGVNIP